MVSLRLHKIRGFQRLAAASLLSALTLLSCQQKAKETGTGSDGSSEYYHPTTSPVPAGTTTTTATPKNIVKDLSLTEDVVLEIGTSKVTIPAGTVHELGKAHLQSFAGTFVNSTTLRMVSESFVLTLTKTDNSDFTMPEIYKNIQIEQKTNPKSTSTKLVALFDENANLATSSKKGLTKLQLAEYLTDLTGGVYKSSIGIRNARVGFVLAETTVGLIPLGYEAFTQAARNPTSLTATVTTPADVTLTWVGDPRFNAAYGIVKWVSGATELDCTYSDAVTATTSTTIAADTTEATYTASLTGLLDATTYSIKICGLTSRTPADSSGGTTITAITPARALAVLTGSPADPSNTTALNITVGGTGVISYKYAVLTNQSSCTGATLSDWTPIATPITTAIAQATGDKVRVCVYGKIDDSNVQLIATEATWTVDKTEPVFTTQALVAPALDGYLSTADRLLTGSILGTLTASGHEVASTRYKIVTSATTCNAAVVYTAVAPTSNSTDITVDGNYKVCVRLADAALNFTYGSSAVFNVDTAIAFTSVALANGAADSYLNLAESSVATAVVSAAVGTGYSTRRYVVAAWATTCNVSLTYSLSIPGGNNANFTANADYKVCVQLSDAAGNTAYGSSNVIHRKVSQPSGTLISLANDVTDTYLSIQDKSLTSDLSTVATGTNYDLIEYAVSLSATACSAVGSWSSTIPKANDAGISVDGSTYYVCAKLSDTAANPAAYISTAMFTYDFSPPLFSSMDLANDVLDLYLSSPDAAAALAVHTVVSGSGFSSEDYAVATSVTTCDGSLTYGPAVKLASDAGFVTGGTYKICTKLADLAGNLTYGETSTTFAAVLATPDCNSLNLANDAADSWINSAERSSVAAISGAAATTLGGAIKTYSLIASAAACDGTATFGGVDVIPQADDAGLADATSYKICAKVTDAAQNTPAYCATAAFTVDTSPPLFGSLPLIGAASDGVVNIAEHAVAASPVAGPLTATGQSAAAYALVTSATGCTILLSYGATIPDADHATLNATGSYKICVQLLDAAGNVTYDMTANFDSDQLPANFNSLDLANEALGGYINLSESISVLDAAGTLDASGQSVTEYGSQTAAGACSAAVYTAGIPTVADVAGLGDGTFKICTRLTDASGNLTYGSTSGVIVDLAVPTFSGSVLVNSAADQYINFAERALTTTMASTTTGTGFDTIHYALAADGSACSAVGVWSASIPKNDDAGFGADGDYIICSKLSDYAGNPDAFGSSSVIHLKTDFPMFTSIDLAGDVADSFMSAADHALANPIVTNLVASGHSSVGYKTVLQATACNVSLTYGALPVGTDTAISSPGNYKVCVALVDVAGNVYYDASGVFEFDATAPMFNSLALAGDVTDLWLNASEHALANDLGDTLDASGYVTAEYAVVSSITTCNSGVTYGSMPKSNDASITDGGTWKLCAKLTDAAGNSSYGTGTGLFQSEFSVPSFSSVSTSGATADGFINAADSVGATDLVTAASGMNHTATGYVVVTSATTCDIALTYNATIPKTNNAAFTADGTYKVCVKLTDTAGNSPAYGDSGPFVRDITVPASAVTTSGAVLPSTTVGPDTEIAGTASDATAGVASVSVSIQEASAGCYSATNNDFSAVCPNWLTATGTTSWTYTVPDDALMKGVTYTVQTRATDLAVATGNVQSAFGSGTFTFTATEGSDLWNNAVVYDSGADDRPAASALDSSGNLFVAGWHTATDKNWMIKKFDKRGNEDSAWNKDVGDNGSDEVARGIALDSSNNVYVVGSRHNGVDLDWWLKKYNSAGTEDTVNWDIILDGNTGQDEAMGVAVDSSNNLYVVGYGVNIAGGSTGEDIWIRKYSSAGVLGCEQKIDGGAGSAADRALAVAVNSSTGKFYVTGYQTTAAADQQMFVRRLRTSDCTVEVTVTGNSVGSSDQAAAIHIDSTGVVYVAGRDSTVDSDWWIRKYSTALALQSEINTAVAGNHEALAVAINASNGIMVGGYKTGATEDGWLRKFNTSLVEDTVLWDKTVDAASGNDRITSIAIGTAADDVGSVYMIGYGTNVASGASGTDWWIRKYAGP